MDILTYNRKIALFNDPYYSLSVELDNVSCNMTFMWNDTTKRYHATLTKQDGTEIFTGVKINAVTAFPFTSLMKQNKLNGMFVLYPLSGTEPTDPMKYRNWADYFILIYETNLVV